MIRSERLSINGPPAGRPAFALRGAHVRGALVRCAFVRHRVAAGRAALVGCALLIGSLGCGGNGDAGSGENGPTLAPGSRGDTPGAAWARVEAEPGRWDADGLAAALRYADSVGSAALLVVDDGVIVGHTGAIGEGYQIASMRKSLLSVLIGIAVDRSEIAVGATLAELDIDDLPPSLTDVERSATVHDLITARSGVYHRAAYEPSSMSDRRPARGSHAPGTFWFYNNWDFNALGTIYGRATGMDVFEGFEREIAGPLQLEDYSLEEQEWVGHPETEHPAYVFRMSARDLARVGLLMLRRGEWGTRRIVSGDWVEVSTAPHVGARAGGAYGYMWWVPVDGRHYEGAPLPDGSFIARGNGPHTMVVMPALDLIVVHLAETNRPRPTTWLDDDHIAAMLARILEARGFRR